MADWKPNMLDLVDIAHPSNYIRTAWARHVFQHAIHGVPCIRKLMDSHIAKNEFGQQKRYQHTTVKRLAFTTSHIRLPCKCSFPEHSSHRSAGLTTLLDCPECRVCARENYVNKLLNMPSSPHSHTHTARSFNWSQSVWVCVRCARTRWVSVARVAKPAKHYFGCECNPLLFHFIHRSPQLESAKVYGGHFELLMASLAPLAHFSSSP